MSDCVVSISGLSKMYNIQHEVNEPYKKFSDSIIKKVKGIVSISRKEVELFSAISNINLEIFKGEKVAIIGRNGAGKSTLLKVLSRITEPTEGEIKIKGRIASLLEVGTGFHPELTGRENIFLNGAVLGMTKKEILSKFDSIVDFSGCEKFLDTPVKRYSSGMRVRLGFAIAAHLESEILIVDEVLAVGDAEFQKKCLGKMDEISKGEGRTIIFVSHDLGAVQQLCEKGIVLDRGKIEYIGDIAGAISSYVGLTKVSNTNRVIQSHMDPINFEVDCIKTVNPLDEDSLFFKAGEPITFDVELDILGKIDKPQIHIAISNHIYGKLCIFEVENLSRKDNRISASYVFENILSPGDYDIQCVVRGNGGRCHSVSCFGFTIDDSHFEGNKIHEGIFQAIERL